MDRHDSVRANQRRRCSSRGNPTRWPDDLLLVPASYRAFVVSAVVKLSFRAHNQRNENAEDLPLGRNSAGSNEGLGSSSQTCGATRLERDSLTIGAGRVGHLGLLPSLWMLARTKKRGAPKANPEIKNKAKIVCMVSR